MKFEKIEGVIDAIRSANSLEELQRQVNEKYPLIPSDSNPTLNDTRSEIVNSEIFIADAVFASVVVIAAIAHLVLSF